MNKKLVIVFVKNILLGKVKTRLAKTIGNQGAFEVYKHLVEITENETEKLDHCDIHIYFSDVIIESKWGKHQKFVQEGEDLGERMQNAFQASFELGYEQVLGIGSDLPDLNAEIINAGFSALEKGDTVFGPADDGGYYLIGMKKIHPCIFKNKSWSTESLLKETSEELISNNISFTLLKQLNDIDTVEDLLNSCLAEKFRHLTQIAK